MIFPDRSDREVYTHGYSTEVQQQMASRTAAASAAFFLPRLQAGMSVLDCGCGPGAITLGLAAAVAPGQVVGVDLEPSQVDAARSLAVARGVTNARFEVASIYQLPFPDRSFDAALAHTVLQHLQDPPRALREIRRVLRPGAVVGVRDDDWATLLWEPSTPMLELATSLITRVWQYNGGDPFYPQHQRRLLREAGFVHVEASASASYRGSEESTRPWAHAVVVHNQQPTFVQTVIDQGWADEATLEATYAAIRAWGESEDAIWAIVMCQAVGWVPDEI